MDIKEEKLREFKEVRRGLAVLFLALLTIEANILIKYVETKDSLLGKIMIFGIVGIILLVIGIFIVSIPIWRILRNGR